MLCVRPDRPVDVLTTLVLREIDRLTKDMTLAYFVAGATARDLILSNVYGLGVRRATGDADFAIAFADWEQFQSIKAALVAGGRFEADPRILQRLYYGPGERMRGYPVDIIPFRGVESPANTVAWPPDMKVVMNVIGYEEVLATALEIEIEEDLVVRVASLPGLALLKIFAWADRPYDRRRDAQDLATLLRTYHEAGNTDRLYGSDVATLQAVDFDLDLAGSRLLGMDVHHMASAGTLDQVRALLDDRRKAGNLVTHMSVEFGAAEDSIAAAERLLEQFKKGLAGEVK